MLVLLIVGPKCRLAKKWPCHIQPLVSHGEYADRTDEPTDGWQTVTLCFLLAVASIIIHGKVTTSHYGMFIVTSLRSKLNATALINLNSLK